MFISIFDWKLSKIQFYMHTKICYYLIIGSLQEAKNTMGTKSDSFHKKNNINKNAPIRPKEHWRMGLLKAMKDPKLIVLEDELIVAIKDCYPKATFHYLVCPKEDIPDLKSVKFENLYLLKHMHEVGENLSKRHKNSNFLIGYHSVPSMVRLHLHVVSDDFDSPSLKTKKHWNSFTTDFFKNSKEVINELEENKKINQKTLAEYQAFLNQPLKCNNCTYMPKNMPNLKEHLKTHLI